MPASNKKQQNKTIPKNLLFCLLFLLLNLILVSPFLVFGWQDNGIRGLQVIQVELLFLALLWLFLGGKWFKIFRPLSFIFTLFILIYNTYDATIRGIYGWLPNFFNEQKLIENGLASLIELSNLSAITYIGIALFLLLFIGLIYWLVTQFCKLAGELHTVTKIALLTLLGLAAFNISPWQFKTILWRRHISFNTQSI